MTELGVNQPCKVAIEHLRREIDRRRSTLGAIEEAGGLTPIELVVEIDAFQMKLAWYRGVSRLDNIALDAPPA